MDDLQLVNRLLEALETARRAVLCAVIASEGSAPRGAGALMAVFGENDACGTVGGGAVERMAQAKAASMLGQTAGTVEHYTMSGADSTTGMICGGARSRSRSCRSARRISRRCATGRRCCVRKSPDG